MRYVTVTLMARGAGIWPKRRMGFPGKGVRTSAPASLAVDAVLKTEFEFGGMSTVIPYAAALVGNPPHQLARISPLCRT